MISMVRQDVTLSKLFLDLFDTSDAVRERFSDPRACHCGPTALARNNRNRD